MSTENKSFSEIYAWNETTLAMVAIGWGVFISTFHEMSEPLVVIGIVVASVGLPLLIVQATFVRTFIDLTAPVFTASRSPKFIVPFILKMWPMSVIIRTVSHFLFTWWWLVIGVSVWYGAYQPQDVRFVMYLGFAFLHADRLIRIIQWMRK